MGVFTQEKFLYSYNLSKINFTLKTNFIILLSVDLLKQIYCNLGNIFLKEILIRYFYTSHRKNVDKIKRFHLNRNLIRLCSV